MYLRGKMEFDVGVVDPFGIQEPFALRQVDRIAVFILRNIGVLETGKVLQFFGIRAGDPAGFVKWQGIELYRCPVFMQEPVLNDLEL